MPTIIHSGIAIAYEERGSGWPACVFVHGWMGNRSLLAGQADYFALNHRVVSIDLRGHGDSDTPRGDYGISLLADDVACVIERLELGKVVAVGHSMGGLVVLQLAAARPQLVEAIVMVDPPPFVLTSEVRALLEGLAASLEAGDRDSRRAFVANNLLRPTSDPKLIEHVLRVAMAAPDHVAASAMRGILAFNGVAVAADCKVPALHIGGERPLNPFHLMSEWLPTVVNRSALGAGHYCQLEAPDQVNAMIDGFVRHYLASPEQTSQLVTKSTTNQ